MNIIINPTTHGISPVCRSTFASCFFYKLLAKKNGFRFALSACIVLAIPYIIIQGAYILFRLIHSLG